VKIVPSIHPAAVLRGQDSGATAKFKDTIISDFLKASQFLMREPNWDERAIWKKKGDRYVSMFPTVEEVADFFRRHRGQLMAVDTETTGEEALDCRLICIGFATEDGDCLNFPVLRQGGFAYWSGSDWERVVPVVREALGAAWWPKVLHNGSFDFLALWHNGFLLDGWTEDTMYMHHVADGELPHSLAYVTSRYLEVPYYKDDVKGDIRWLDLDDVILRSYNLRDVLTTVRAVPPLQKEMMRWKLERLYRAEIALSKVMLRGTLKGLMVDLDRRDSMAPITDQFKLDKKGKPTAELNPDYGLPSGLGPRMEWRRQEGLNALHQIAGSTQFNPASPIQLRAFLYDYLKFPIMKRSEKTNMPSTDKETMVLLSIHAEAGVQRDALKNLAKWRRADKILSTWIRGLHVLGDGRVHPGWKIHGTVSGRLSSSPNFQNFSKPIKRIFRAADGSKFVGIDLSQAELRVMAYLANDPEMLRMYREGLNVHTINATLLFGVRNPGVDTNAATEAYLELVVPQLLGKPYQSLPVAPADKWGRIRRLAKNFVFACNYGAMPETIYDTLHAELDPDTDQPMFPDLDLGLIESLKITWEMLHPAIPEWWKAIVAQVQMMGRYQSPLSGRIRWFRGGFKRNEILNFPIQEMVAAHMERVVECAGYLDQATGWGSVINSQVHDAVNAEAEDRYVDVTKEIFGYVFNRPFDIPGIVQGAILPADAATVGTHLDQV
jgi:hypothetical protein